MLWRQQPSDFFFIKGDLNAPADGVRWPGMRRPISWLIFGPAFAMLLSAFYLGGLTLLTGISLNQLSQVIPLLPPIFLFALMNAFGEEFTYRAAPLSQLWHIVGKNHAIGLTAIWFGLGHYYGGIPSGVFGAIQTGLVALLFGKAMLETKGIVMPVFMHMWGDVIVYTFLALAAMAAGPLH